MMDAKAGYSHQPYLSSQMNNEGHADDLLVVSWVLGLPKMGNLWFQKTVGPSPKS